MRAGSSRSRLSASGGRDTLYVLTVSKAARAADGGALRSPVRSAVLTAQAGSGSIAATRMSGKRVRLDTAFRIRLDKPVTTAAVKAAIRIEPEVAGDVSTGGAAGEYLFTPEEPLAVDVAYTVSLPGLVDSDGVAFASVPNLSVQTSAAPGVVRFRPRAGDAAVARTAAISVRFTERMDNDLTAGAFHVTVGSTKPQGLRLVGRAGSRARLRPRESSPVRREGSRPRR